MNLNFDLDITGVHSRLTEPQTIEVKCNSAGTPLPILCFDFDGTGAFTIINWIAAFLDTASMHSDTSMLRLPSVSSIETGTTPLRNGNRHLFGISERFTEEEMWNTIVGFVLKHESRTPSRVPFSVQEAIREYSDRFQIVFVTANCAHDIVGIVKRDTGVDVDVVRSAGFNKQAVLSKLVEHHHSSTNCKGMPMLFFGDAVADMESATFSPKKVVPVGVIRSLRNRHKRDSFSWEDHARRLFEAGGRYIITHEGVGNAIKSLAVMPQ